MSESANKPTVTEIKLPQELIFQSMTDGGYDYFLKNKVMPFVAERKSLVADLQTATGRSKTISAAMEVTKQKTAMTKIVIEFAKDLETKPKEIRANMKKLEEFLDVTASEIRQPVSDFEAPRRQGIEHIKKSIVFDGFKPTSTQIRDRLDWLNTTEIDKSFYADFYSDAIKSKSKAEQLLTELFEKTASEEAQALELAETLKKAERAQWVNDIAAMGYNLAELPLHQLQSRIDELNALVIDEVAYVEQYENVINARFTSLNAVNYAINVLKESDAKTKREDEFKNLKNLPIEAKNWTPDGILIKIEQLKSFNYKSDYWKELYGDVIDEKQVVIKKLDLLRVEKIVAAQKIIDDTKAEADKKAEQYRIKAEQEAKEATARAVREAEEKAAKEAKAKEDAEAAARKKEQDAIDKKAKADVERIANEQHRNKIKAEAVQAIYSYLTEYWGESPLNENRIMDIIDLIEGGEIPHIKVEF